ncbi:serine/threonine protein kinase [Nocardia sp. 2]|uniref:non-specific serine/threonine protein kinase n=1 Tax=Nocardia acididurans TaxID=2802282 RepID=A0ABS1MB46_9NOCA|nr:serine/threonine-protein kinase [Nocardia acididurans]MBL1077837.1 serine/threonine protein kinase [Nocardia acididurans]
MVALTPGTEFAGYRIERRLGAGGMGTVYLARHPRLPRRDAVKVLDADIAADAAARARFLREAESAARLDHPNIVSVHDRGFEQGHFWIAMQYVDGSDVARLIDQRRVSPRWAIEILAAAAAGLDEAHRHGLVHRDVKPANLLISAGDNRVLVADFGIAHSTGAGSALTEAGVVLASLPYAAPEQIEGGRIDHRVDVYALGCTLYQMLTGRTPFPRASAAAVMYAHLTEPPPRVSELDPALPAELDRVIAAALAKDPRDRYGSCGELAAAADAALRGGPAPIPIRASRPSRSSRRRAGLLAGAAVLAVAVTAAAGVQLSRGGDGGPDSSSAPRSTGPATTTTAAAPWGAYQFVVDTFPKLLPALPQDTGYAAVSCRAVDGDLLQAPLSTPVPVNRMSCQGRNDPLEFFLVACNSDRSPMPAPTGFSSHTIESRQPWTRASGGGALVASHRTEPMPDLSSGRLSLTFDGERAFCVIDAYGGALGQELIDGWWKDAPV